MNPAVPEDPCFHILDDGDQDPEVAEGGPTRSFPASSNAVVPAALELPPPNRIKLQWTKRSCGGPAIHGGASCGYGEDVKFVSSCTKLSNQFNYELYNQFVIYVQKEKMHLTNNEQQWSEFSKNLFSTVWKRYLPITGKNLKPKWFTTVKNELEGRHDISETDAKGYETHQDYSPYDRLVIGYYHSRQSCILNCSL